MVGAQVVILLSIGSFQVQTPMIPGPPSPVFEDSKAGVAAFVTWARGHIPEPKWNQRPMQVCVVGAQYFTPEHAPYLTKQLYESKQPLHQLEPYSATFHYVPSATEKVAGGKRTLKQALEICAKAGWK